MVQIQHSDMLACVTMSQKLIIFMELSACVYDSGNIEAIVSRCGAYL